MDNERENNGNMDNGHHDDSMRDEPVNGGPVRMSDDENEDELQFSHNNENEAHYYGNESPRYLDNFSRGKASKFYINGDKFFPARKVVYNPKHFKDFATYLDFLTQKLEPRFGAVRKIHTPHHGHRIRSLKDIQAECGYVVAGVEGFKTYPYDQITSTERKKAPPFKYDADPVYHSRQFQSSGRINKMETHSILIKVWANGKDLKGPRRVLLTPRVLPFNLANVMGHVDEMLAEDCQGTVDKLYMMNGIKVSDVDQIVQNGEYVACRKAERFKRARYTENGYKNISTSPRLERKFLAPIGNRSSNSTSNSSPEHSNASTQNSVNGPGRRRPPRREEDTVFPAKPVKHTRSSDKSRQVDLDRDEGGVFKAKQNNRNRGAREVQENRHTRTEVPVDQRVAKEVQEERFDNRRSRERQGGVAAKPNSRRPMNEANRRSPPDGGGAKANSRQQQQDRQREVEAKRQKEAQELRERQEREKQEREKQQRQERDRLEKARQDKEIGERKRQEREKQEKDRLDREREERERQAAAAKNIDDDDDDYHGRGSSIRKSDDDIMPEEDKAAAKIQAGFRGHQTRKTLKENKTLVEKAEDEVREKVKDFSESAEKQQETVTSMVEEDVAAARIQAGYRGYKTRKTIKEGKEKAKEFEERAEDKVEEVEQKVKSKIMEAEDTFESRMRDEEEAAAKIQAGFRGYQTRKSIKIEKELAGRNQVNSPTNAAPPPREETYDSLAQEHDAATKIQSQYRGYKARLDYQIKREAAK